MTNEDICNELQNQNVTEVYRIQKREGDNKVPTDTFIVTFETSNLPKEVKIGYYNVKVELYIPNPRRCFNCQKFGHGKNTCKHSAVCAKCSESGHSYEDCPSEEPKCINCEQKHTSSSRSCPMWKLEKKIIEHKYRNDVTFKDAKAHIYTSNPQLVSAIPSLQNLKTTPTTANVVASATPSALHLHQQRQLEMDIMELKNQITEIKDLFGNFFTLFTNQFQLLQNTQNISQNSTDMDVSHDTQDTQNTQGQKRYHENSENENLDSPLNKRNTHPSGKEGSTSLAHSPSNNQTAEQKVVDEESFKEPNKRRSRQRRGESHHRSCSRSPLNRNRSDSLSQSASSEETGGTKSHAAPPRPPHPPGHGRRNSHSSNDSSSTKPERQIITGP